ncbi:MAG: Gfo/Idh/MocA family oxidoreductase [Pseudomonadota bacterium]
MIDLLVAGAGLVGRRHVEAVGAVEGVRVTMIADPSADARIFAGEAGAAWAPSLEAALADIRPDGIVLATPNQLHVEDGLRAVAAGIPCLIEKPIATSASEGQELVDAAARAGVPLLVGHHRRHNPLMAAAKQAIDEGQLGDIVTSHGMFWLFKPDDYFDAPWRRAQGAGPVFVNLIHDIDLLSWLVGSITEVQARTSNRTRGHQIEDTAAILLTFENGALGTFSVSDTVVAPWSWELTAGENPVYPHTAEPCYWIGGTHGSLDLPQNRIWRHDGARSWWEPIVHSSIPSEPADPLLRQIENFRDVILGEAEPVVSGEAGLSALRVIEAVHASAYSGAPVHTD